MIQKSQHGDSSAYEKFLQELIPLLQRFLSGKASEDDQEDIIQNILISLHRALHTYDTEKSFFSWFYAIARYKLIDFYRQSGRNLRLQEKIMENFALPASAEKEFSLEECLTRLPIKQQRIIKLLKIDGLSIREVADLTGFSESSVKVTAHRGYKKLKEMFS